MSLEQVDKIDFIGTEKDSGQVVLTIADAWDWENEEAHLLALQEKLNAYLMFIESGQLLESYPVSEGKQIRIDVIFRCSPTDGAMIFLEKASDVASDLDVLFRYDTFSESRSGGNA